MNFTKEQIETLSQFERHFDTAVYHQWTRNPGLTNLKTIHAIMVEAVDYKPRLNASCGTCILNLISYTGKLYFEDKEEIRKAEEALITAEPKPKRTRKKKEATDEIQSQDGTRPTETPQES